MTPSWRLGPLWVALAGCAHVLDIPDDPELVATGPWRCLGEPQPTPVPAASSALVEVIACDLVTKCKTRVTGLSARLCARPDTDCDSPLSVDIVDEGGLLSFTVPTPLVGFDGYLEVTSASELCTNPSLGELGPVLCGLSPACDTEAPDAACEVPLYARALLFFNPPIVSDTSEPLSLPLLPSTAIPTLAAAAHAGAPDPTAGHLFITALDCDSEPAAGVSYRIDRDQDRVTPLYPAEAVPNDTAVETDGSGIGGFLGVPAGLVRVTGNNAELREIGAISAFAAPSTVSYTFLAPGAAASP